jgi:hypothetical protein
MEPGSGRWDIDLYILAIAPASWEVDENEPLVGPSGSWVSRGLAAVGLRRPLKIRKANLVNCRIVRPGKGGLVNRSKPTIKEARECASRWLLPELKALAEHERSTLATNFVFWSLAQATFDIIFRKHGVFGKSCHQRLQRDPKKRSFHVLAGDLERWIEKGKRYAKKKDPKCLDCGVEITRPKRKCDKCRKT